MRKVWVSQDTKQVRKHGPEASSWYVGWRDPFGRRRCKSFGPGPDGKERATQYSVELARSLNIGCYIEPAGTLPFAINGISKEEVDRLSGVQVVYFIEAVGLERVKIGYTDNLRRRLTVISSYCPVAVKVLAIVRGSRQEENSYHKRFASARIRGEWFQMTVPLKRMIAGLKDLNELDHLLKTPFSCSPEDEAGVA